MRQIFTHTVFCILQTMHGDLTKAKNLTDYGNKGLSLTHWMRPKLNSITPQSIWQWTRAGFSSGSTFQRKEIVSATKFTNSVMNQGIHMTWGCTWIKTHTPPLTTWLQQTQLLDIWLYRVEGLGHKIFMDNVFSSPSFLMTWTDVK